MSELFDRTSILLDIKKMLGLDENYSAFDRDVIININSAFLGLNQLGIGPEDGFSISGESDSWEDFVGNEKRLECIKQYIFLRVKTIFDPPASSAVAEAYNKQMAELEFRMNVFVDPKSIL